MTEQLYSGTIDWERIYSLFHSPRKIAKRIICELDDNMHPLVFSGFAETAACLTKQIPVTFVDMSPSVTTRASECFPSLGAVHTGNITQDISSYPDNNVVIACRISAYWGKDEFDSLANSLRKFPRRRILIDFFDRDVIEPMQSIKFESYEGNGEWIILDIEDSEDSLLPISKVRLNVSYSLQDNSFSYEGDRSFFRKIDIERWFKAELPEYQIRVCAPLIDLDPSFTIVISNDNISY